MNRQEIIVGQVWKRRKPLGDPYDEVRVAGRVDFAGQREDEWTLSPVPFGNVIQTDAAGILEFCDLLTPAAEPEDWS
jgi:hypothetical protein